MLWPSALLALESPSSDLKATYSDPTLQVLTPHSHPDCTLLNERAELYTLLMLQQAGEGRQGSEDSRAMRQWEGVLRVHATVQGSRSVFFFFF